MVQNCVLLSFGYTPGRLFLWDFLVQVIFSIFSSVAVPVGLLVNFISIAEGQSTVMVLECVCV